MVVSALGVGLRLWTKGLLSAEKLMIFMILVVIAAAIDSGWIKFVLAIAGIGFFLLDYTNYDVRQFYAVSGSVLALLIALFGLFVMFGGMRRK